MQMLVPVLILDLWSLVLFCFDGLLLGSRENELDIACSIWCRNVFVHKSVILTNLYIQLLRCPCCSIYWIWLFTFAIRTKMEHFSVLWRCYVTADMQEKAPFVSKAEKLKAEYNKKMDAYNNKTVYSALHSHRLTLPAHWSFIVHGSDVCPWHLLCRLEALQLLVTLTSPSPRWTMRMRRWERIEPPPCSSLCAFHRLLFSLSGSQPHRSVVWNLFCRVTSDASSSQSSQSVVGKSSSSA